MSQLLATLQAEFRDWALSVPQRYVVTISSFVRGPRFPGDESQHQLGLAADFVDRRTGDTIPVEAEAIADEARALGFVAVPEHDHLHVQRFRAGFLRSCGLV